jgi:hypothetical protein
MRLDDLCRQEDLTADYLKLDVEGAELDRSKARN